MNSSRLAAVLSALLAVSFVVGHNTPVTAFDNWPQWRGEKLDSISNETAIPVNLSADTQLWRVELPGPAGSSPIVWNDQVFVTSANGDALELLAFDSSGKQLWAAKLGGQNRTLRMDSGANYAAPSPSTDGEHIWATSSAGVLTCFKMDGSPVWTLDLQEKYGEFDIQFGMTSTPVLDNGKLYLQLIHGNMRDPSPGIGIILALDGGTGKELWRHERKTDATFENKHSYASPTIYRDGELAMLITHGGDVATGHSLEDGHELWRVGGLNPRASYNNFLRLVASPACAPGMIVIPSAKGGPVLCIRPGVSGQVNDDDNERAFHWRLARGTSDVATPVIYDGFVYLCVENGALACIDAKTGEEVYRERLLEDRHRSTPVVVEGKLYITGRQGTVLVVAAGREPKVLAENSLGEPITASPAVSNGRIYVRTYDALYAFGAK